ncbi:MAG: M20/M25/M40 family metallo-hydrolase [Oscillospiraceae bacterium]|nr:M20/M25/M40 family metallo-hydrolase [Oscillospiraceae bacterium]
MDYIKLRNKIKEYAEIPRVSGYEGEAVHRFADDLKPYCDEVTIDRIGNVIGTIKGTEDGRSLMIFAHIDTIGFLVSCLNPDGFLKLERQGGVPEKLVQGTPILVGSENGKWYPGVIGARAYQTMSESERGKADPLSSLSADIGVNSEDKLHELEIEVGCPVCYYPVFYDLEDNRICGAYLDNAVGMAQLLALAEYFSVNRPKVTLHLVGTVWEETNAKGAMIAARTARTDMAICLLSPGCSDTPDLKGVSNVTMDGGPCVTVMNFHGKTLDGQVAHKGMFEHLKSSAKNEGIRLQRCILRGALSDSAYLQLEGEGIPVLDMGAPYRYAHSPKEVISLKDVDETITVLKRFVSDLTSDFSLNRF